MISIVYYIQKQKRKKEETKEKNFEYVINDFSLF